MSFDSFGEFLAMGGHGFYVWWSYLLTLVVVGFILVWPLWRRRRFLTEQRGRLQRADALGNRAEVESHAPEA
ncbi:MAG: heme exporter protein CcmD [Gammaproteobacteria bacterium]|nr:heme exporter protein CcmD [Gammaproteobacteria bacterium]